MLLPRRPTVTVISATHLEMYTRCSIGQDSLRVLSYDDLGSRRVGNLGNRLRHMHQTPEVRVVR